MFKKLIEGNMAPVLWGRGSMLRVEIGEVRRRFIQDFLGQEEFELHPESNGLPW